MGGTKRQSGGWRWAAAFALMAPLLAACGAEDDEEPAFETPADSAPTTSASTTSTAPAQVTVPSTTTDLPLTGPASDEEAASATAEDVEGQITHDVPPEMVVGDSYRVEVRIGAQKTPGEFEKAVEESGGELDADEQANIDPLPRVTPEMTVLLTAPASFEVQAENSPRQALGDDGVARWGYLIQPTEPGDHDIRISAEVNVGDAAQALEPVYDGTVVVQVAETSLWDDLRSRAGLLVGVLVVIATLASGVGGAVAIRDHLGRRGTDGSDDAPTDSPGSGGTSDGADRE